MVGVMHQSEINPAQLRRQVEAEFARYASSYSPPGPGETYGIPWSKERAGAEVEEMTALLVDPCVEKGTELFSTRVPGLCHPLALDLQP